MGGSVAETGLLAKIDGQILGPQGLRAHSQGFHKGCTFDRSP